MTQVEIMLDGYKLNNLDRAMPQLRYHLSKITDKDITESVKKSKSGGDPLGGIQRGIVFDDMMIRNGVPIWFAYNIRRTATLPDLSPQAAETILITYNQGKFRPSVTSKLARLVRTGYLQRTAKLANM